ncbi:MAG: hypothetical protein DSM106950_08590 [Stigonema ocellatum SAG 48.90 = DSM 106950]|nr:hypothetical protein [Stigonema ocellatum SAG 48.90 = DSM 106950]
MKGLFKQPLISDLDFSVSVASARGTVFSNNSTRKSDGGTSVVSGKSTNQLIGEVFSRDDMGLRSQ